MEVKAFDAQLAKLLGDPRKPKTGAKHMFRGKLSALRGGPEEQTLQVARYMLFAFICYVYNGIIYIYV